MRDIKFRAWNKVEDRMIYKANIIGANQPDIQQEWEFMQYTGLKDKNRKEIYEGDIIAMRFTGGENKGEISRQHIVKWGVYNIGANGYEYDFNIVGPFVKDEYMYHNMIEGNVEVVGNIYENPELLEVIDA